MRARDFRDSMGLTLQTLSTKTGYSKAAISKWERNVETIPDGYIEKIKELYNVDIEKEYNNLRLYKEDLKNIKAVLFKNLHLINLINTNNGKSSYILTNATKQVVQKLVYIWNADCTVTTQELEEFIIESLKEMRFDIYPTPTIEKVYF